MEVYGSEARPEGLEGPWAAVGAAEVFVRRPRVLLNTSGPSAFPRSLRRKKASPPAHKVLTSSLSSVQTLGTAPQPPCPGQAPAPGCDTPAPTGWLLLCSAPAAGPGPSLEGPSLWSGWKADVGPSGGGGWSACEAEQSRRKNNSPGPPTPLPLCCINLPLTQGFSTWLDLEYTGRFLNY